MANLIFTAYAYDPDMSSSANMLQSQQSMELYLKNAFVCLATAKHWNPEDRVMLATNITPPKAFVDLFEAHHIEVCVIPFSKYKVPSSNVPWGLAFYKLNALDYLSKQTDCEKFAMIDTDTVTVRSYHEMWHDAENYLLLHQVIHSFENSNERIMQNELKQILNLNNEPIHWGGELICGTVERVRDMMTRAEAVFSTMKDSGKWTTRGDEFILTAVGTECRIKAAQAYIDRCWTSDGYYLCTTAVYSTPLAILHVPDEKRRGMLLLFHAVSKGDFPERKKICSMLRPPNSVSPFTRWKLLDLISRIKQKIAI